MSAEPPNADRRRATSTVERAVEAATLGLGPRLDRNATRALAGPVESDPDVPCADRRARRARSSRTEGERARCVAARDMRRRCGRSPTRGGARAGCSTLRPTRATMIDRVLTLLADDDALVAEAAAFALGELGHATTATTDVATQRGARARRPITPIRSYARPRSPRSARSATPTRYRRCSPRRTTGPRSAAARCSRSPRSKAPRSKRRFDARPHRHRLAGPPGRRRPDLRGPFDAGTMERGPVAEAVALERSSIQRRRPSPAGHEHLLEAVEALEAAAGAEHDALERRVDEVHRQVGLLLDAPVEPCSIAAAADEVHAVRDQVLRELGRRAREARDDRVADRAHLLLDRAAHLLGHEHDRLRQAGHEVAAAHLGLALVVDRIRRADRELDLLRRALADRDAVLAAHVAPGSRRRCRTTRRAPPRARRRRRARSPRPRVVPPPMSTTMLPSGSWIGSDAPIAAAIGCSMRYVCAAPARRAASSTARCSTWVIADGTQISTRARGTGD